MTMRYVALLLIVILVGYPLTIVPAMAVAVVAGGAVALCALGILAGSTTILTAGLALALGEYALALVRSGDPPRLAGAVVAGVAVALLLEVGNFAGRFRRVELGPGVVASQLRYWARFGVVGGAATLVLAGAAGALSASVSLPLPPVLAAVGAVIALGAAVAVLRRATRPGADDPGTGGGP